jgi:hypothetical protein
MNGIATILACAWALLRHRPLAIARGLFPWLVVAAMLSLLGRDPHLRVIANLLAVFSFAFCISLFASTYAAMAYPDHARPSGVLEELTIATVALWKTIMVLVVLAVSARLVLGIDVWHQTHGISLVVLILCLTFFVTESHVKESISLRRLAGAFLAMPFTMGTIVMVAMVWAIGIEVMLNELNQAQHTALADETVPGAVQKVSAVAYVFFAAGLTYVRICGVVALFVALHAFGRNRAPAPARPQPQPVLARATD